MKHQRNNWLLQLVIMLGCLFASSESAWAISDVCAVAADGTGIGGTGISGTGIIARGTGIGGTGIQQDGVRLAGSVLFSSGHVEAKNQRNTRTLTKGDQVCVGDTLQTGQGAVVHVRMQDGGLIQLRQNSQLAIEQFIYNGVQDGSERSSLALLQGGFRAVTGAVGKLHKENYSIHTANATISIRGTDHEIYFVSASRSGQDAAAEPGTYDHVISGGTALQNEYGTVLIEPDQTGFMPLHDSAPMLLDITPEIFGDRDAEYGAGDRREESDGHSEHAGGTHEMPEKSDAPEMTDRPESLERPELMEQPEIMERPEGLEGGEL